MYLTLRMKIDFIIYKLYNQLKVTKKIVMFLEFNVEYI